MKKEILSAYTLLEGSNISMLDAARLIRNALDSKPNNSAFSDIAFCSKIIEDGKSNLRISEKQICEGFTIYLGTKKDLRRDSLRDIRYLGNRLLDSNSKLAKTYFSQLSIYECENWLETTFTTPSQFNKARAMLHGLFEFALRREWCSRNIVKLVTRKKIVELQIEPLTLSQTKRILNTAQSKEFSDCAPAVAMLVLAGIRPRELSRLYWKDIDLKENYITVRSQCSKTGGVRHVEICHSLNKILLCYKKDKDEKICPSNWSRRWKLIRRISGFDKDWVQDVLRHTYASFHAKCFRDLPRLQLNMGHSNTALLRSRYINMSDISREDAEKFFKSN